MSTLHIQTHDMQAYCYGSDRAISIQRPKRPDKEGERFKVRATITKMEGTTIVLIHDVVEA
jgi:hypothetical protein